VFFSIGEIPNKQGGVITQALPTQGAPAYLSFPPTHALFVTKDFPIPTAGVRVKTLKYSVLGSE